MAYCGPGGVRNRGAGAKWRGRSGGGDVGEGHEVATIALRGIERAVGGVDQPLQGMRLVRRAGADGHADRHRNRHLRVVRRRPHGRLGDHPAQPFGGGRGGVEIGGGHGDQEFLAAVAHQEIDFAHIGLEPPRRLDQHLVADVVAEGVVDAFEPVEIQQHQRERLAGLARLGDDAAHVGLGVAAIVEPGERVEHGEAEAGVDAVAQRVDLEFPRDQRRKPVGDFHCIERPLGHRVGADIERGGHHGRVARAVVDDDHRVPGRRARPQFAEQHQPVTGMGEIGADDEGIGCVAGRPAVERAVAVDDQDLTVEPFEQVAAPVEAGLGIGRDHRDPRCGLQPVRDVGKPHFLRGVLAAGEFLVGHPRAQQVTHQGEQGDLVEGLGKIIIGAGRQGLQPGGARRHRVGHDHGDGPQFRVGLQRAAGRETAGGVAGKVRAKDHHIGVVGPRRRQQVLAGGGLQDVVPGRLELRLQDDPARCGGICDEYAAGHVGCCASGLLVCVRLVNHCRRIVNKGLPQAGEIQR